MCKKNKLDGDTSVMTYKGHSLLHTLIRCHFSPEFTTGQRYVYTGCSTGSLVSKYRQSSQWINYTERIISSAFSLPVWLYMELLLSSWCQHWHGLHTLKFYKVFCYVIGKAVSGELPRTQTDLVCDVTTLANMRIWRYIFWWWWQCLKQYFPCCR